MHVGGSYLSWGPYKDCSMWGIQITRIARSAEKHYVVFKVVSSKSFALTVTVATKLSWDRNSPLTEPPFRKLDRRGHDPNGVHGSSNRNQGCSALSQTSRS